MRAKVVPLLVFLLSLWALIVIAPQNTTDDEAATRIALAINIVDKGRLDIDRFAADTGDRAHVGGHVYADKTPGQSFLAVPVVAFDKLIRTGLGLSTDATRPEVRQDYTTKAVIFVNCVISALAAAIGYLVLPRLGAPRSAALFAAMALALASPFYGWTTAFFAHSITGSFLLFGFALIVFRLDGDGSPAPRRDALLLGVLLGYTCVVDLTALPACAGLGVLALVRLGRGLWPAAGPPLVLGGVVGLLPLPIYNQLAFGSALHLGYADTEFPGMAQGIFGVGWPEPMVLLQLLFGFYRGLLPLSPILLLVPGGLVALGRRRGGGALALGIGFVIVAYLCINAGYYYWDGGWSVGPRQLVPMLPLASLALAFAWPKRAPARLGVLVLLVASLLLSLASALAGMFAPDTIANVITGWILPQLQGPKPILRALLVLPVWIAFAVLLKREARADAEPASPEPAREQAGPSPLPTR